MMLHKFIYKIGQTLRNPSLEKQYLFLKKTEQYSLQELENYQLQQLQELVQFSYQHSAYYKSKFDELNIKPDDIKSLTDLSKLPFLTKQKAIQHCNEIQSKAKFKKQFKANTSGSTGEALNYLREEIADSFNRAVIQRGYSWYGVHPSDRNGYFWGFNFSPLQKLKTQLLDGLQNRFRLFSYQNQYFKIFIQKLKKAVYIQGYSSMIYETARQINQKQIPKPQNIKLIKGTSEKIFDHYHEEVIQAFGSKMVSEYGAAETGIIAFECPEGNMHITMEGVIIEEIDNEIVVTNLQLKSFPFIRYKLGDYITLDEANKKCNCGLQHKILKEVTGRVGNSVYGNQNIYPSLYFYYIFKNLVKQYNLKLNYQVIQKEKGNLTFLIEESLTLKEKEYLQEEIFKYFNNDIVYVIQQKVKNKDFTQKKKSFISLYLHPQM